ncbi:MAG: single-stranded DNA-binding protein [Zetaproteobacteria bacterium]|nr:MAG: single-stranded DNA-binding protein [Zetaproteobacteria bacterium]
MINKVILIGNLGQDPELRYTQDGTPVCNVRIATTERFKNRQGEMQERTEWHNVVFWGRLAEIAAEHLKKGDRVYVEGRLQSRTWQDNQGNNRITVEIRASEMKMLGGRRGGRAGSEGLAEQEAAAPAASKPSKDPFAAPMDATPPEEDDIPF